MSMWDGVHAGLEAATLYRASQAQATLAAMHATAQAEAANEASRRDMLEAMKSYIFNVSCVIQRVEEQIIEFPLQVHIVAKSLSLKLRACDLTAQSFPDLQDKEYFFKTEKKIAEVEEKAEKLLTDEQLKQSDAACGYIAEMSGLDATIASKAAQDSLKETEQEWHRLDSRQGRRGLYKGIGILGVVISLLASCPLSCVAMGMRLAPRNGTRAMGLIILMACGVALAGSIALLVLGLGSKQPYFTLQEKRAEWKRQLLSEKDWALAVSKFGDKSREGYGQMREDRMNYLTPLLGGDLVEYLCAD